MPDDDNIFIVNNEYQGGSGVIVTSIGNFEYDVINTPSQPSGITGAPNSGYLHSASKLAIQDNILCCSFTSVDGLFLNLEPENVFARMSNDINTVGYSSVSFDFWWLCAGGTKYYGEIYYSTNGGSSWTQITSPISQFYNSSTWQQHTVSLPQFANQPTLRFGFRFVNQLLSIGENISDPGFAIDEVTVTGIADIESPTISTDFVPLASYCPGSQINVDFSATDMFSAGNVFTVELSDANGNFTSSIGIGSLNSSADWGTVSATIPLDAAPGTGYQVRVVASDPASIGTANGTSFAIEEAPEASAIPTTPTVICNGQTVSFSYTGTDGTVQWQSSINGTDYTDIDNATGNTYTSFPITENIWIRAIVNGTCGTDESEGIAITIENLSAEIEATSSTTLCSGGTATFSFSGSEGSIQWQFSTDGTTFENIGEPSLDTLFISAPLTENTWFKAEVVTDCGTLASSPVLISISETATASIEASTPTSICNGQTVSFSYTGTDGTIQWQSSTDGNEYIDIPLAGGNSYTTLPLSENSWFKAVVSAACGTAESEAIAVTVESISAAIEATGSTTICAGGTATFSFSGSEGSIQWQFSTDGTTFENIGEPSLDTLFISNPLTENTWFKAEVITDCGTLASSPVLISISETVTASIEASTQTSICNGQTVSFSYTGTDGTIQWQSSTDGNEYIDIPLAGGNSYTTLPLSENSWFKAVVNAACGTAESEAIAVTVGSISAAIEATSPTTICAGGTATFSFSGSEGSIQWQFSTDGTTFENIGEPSLDTLFISAPLTENTWFKAEVITACGTLASSAILISVGEAITANIEATTPTTICDGETVSFSYSGSEGTLQWRFSTDGVEYNDILSANNNVYTSLPLSENTWFIASLTGECGTVTSNSIAITVETITAEIAAPGSTVLCTGGMATLSFSGSEGSIQWQFSTDGTTFENIGEPSLDNNFISNPLTEDTWFKAEVSTACGTLASSPLLIRVSETAIASIEASTPTAVCNGQTVSFSYTGTDGAIQWQLSADGTEYIDIPLANGNNYTTLPLSEDTWFKAVVSGACGTAESEAIAVTVESISAAIEATSPTTICADGTATFSFNGSEGSIQWQFSTDGNTFENIGEPSPANIFISNPLTGNTWFKAEVSTACGTLASSAVLISVNEPPAASIEASTPTAVCEGQTVSFSYTGTTGAVQWQFSVDGTVYINIPLANGNNYTTLPLSENTWFKAAVSGACGTDESESIAVTVESITAGIEATGPTTICSGGSTTFLFTGSDGTIQWQSSANGTSFGNISGATGTTLSSGALAQNTWFRAVLTSNCGATETESILVEVTDAGTLPVTTTPAGVTSICSGSALSLSIPQGYTNIQWQPTNETTTSITIESAGIYSVSATAPGGCTVVSEPLAIGESPRPEADFEYTQPSGYLIMFENTSTNGNTYLWTFYGQQGNIVGTNTSQSPTFIYPFDGTYQVQLIVTNDCGSDTLIVDVAVAPLSIGDTEGDVALTVYPNPFNDILQIVAFANTPEQVELSIFNTIGQVVHTELYTISGESTRVIDLSAQAGGVYFVRIASGKDQPVIRKVIKN